MARLLVTRPIEQAEGLAERLRALGHDVLVEPMLRVRYLDAALPPLDGVQAVLLTSRNGALALAQATDRRDIRLIAVGDATAAEASAAGFPHVESADGDAASLLDYVVRALRPEDGAVLHVGGFDVAVDIAEELASKGFQADRVVLYEAEAADALSPAARQALVTPGIDAVLFHSPRSAKTFAQLVESAGLAPRLRGTTALALSDQVADGIRHLGWRQIKVAAAPNEAAMLALLEEPVAAEPPPIQPSRPPSRGAGLVLAVLAGLIAGAAAAYGVVTWLPRPAEERPAPPAMPDTAALEQRLASLEQRIAAIRQPGAEVEALPARVAALEARPAPPDPAARIDQIAQQLRQLEARPAAPAGEAAVDGDATERVAALEQQVKSLAERAAAPSDLPDRVAAVERQSKAVADRLAAAAPPAGEALRVALVLGVGELSEQVLSGRPYAEALSQVEALLGTEKTLAAPLQAHAASGVPTLATLRRDFDPVARGVVEAAAGEGDHWLDHVRGRLAALFVLRRTGEVPGDAPDAIVARAEARLESGDVAAATAETAKLTGRAAEAAAGWQKQAEARLEAEQTLAALKRRAFELARAGLK